jgi:hypothetical protein
MEIPYLTDKGRKWAEKNAMTSMLANIALHAHSSTWPVAHRRAAVIVANEEGEKTT